MEHKGRRQKKYCASGRDILGYLLLGISVVLLGKSLMLCFSNDIWYDELFTVGLIEHSYGELVGLTAQDVHPPLYYMITKVFVDLCKLMLPEVSTVAAAKMVSVLPYFVLLLYSVTFVRKRFSIFAGGLLLFCAAAMPQLSGYTVEMRMYSWAFLFVTAAFLHGYGMVCVPDGKDADLQDGPGRTKGIFGKVSVRKLHGAAMACYGLAAAYTQYFAAVSAAMVYLYVLVEMWRRDRRRIPEWLLWVAVSVSGYAAWLMILYRQITAVHANYWILPLSWRSLGGCVKFLMKPAFTNEVLNVVLAVVMTGIYTAVVLYSVIRMIKCCHQGRVKDGGNAGGLVWTELSAQAVFLAAGVGVLAGLVLFGFAASILLRPVFVYRYMIPAMGCFWLSFAVGVDYLWNMAQEDVVEGTHVSGNNSLHNVELCKQNKRIRSRRTGSGIAMGITVMIVIVGLRDYRAFMGEEEYKIRLMKETEAALSSIAKEDVVLYNFDQLQAVTAYYLPAETESYLWRLTPETLIQDIIRPFDTLEETAEIRKWCEEGRTVWFLGSFNSRDAVVEEWEADGLRIEEIGSYLLERYWFNLYRISI